MNLDDILHDNEERGLFETAPIMRYKVYTDDDRNNSRATFFDLKKAFEYVKTFLHTEKAYIVKETSEIICVREK